MRTFAPKPKAVAASDSFSRLLVQPKLIVNTPGDANEREADLVADRVMRLKDGEPTVGQRLGLAVGQVNDDFERQVDAVANYVVRMQTGDAPIAEPMPSTARLQGSHRANCGAPSVQRVLASSGGHAMPREARQFIERRTGHDFSNVRVHTDARAADSAAAIHAKAYTSGSHIVFGKGQYQPQSEAGKRLLAHELTHVVQQSANTQQVIQRSSDDDAERKSRIAGNVNSGGNIIGPVIDAMSAPIRTAQALGNAAIKQANRAAKAVKAAGSGASRLKSLKASKAAKAAAKASRAAAKAARLAQQGSTAAKVVRGAAAHLQKLPLNAIGFGAAAVSKWYATPNKTTVGKLADSSATAGLDTAFSMAHPVTAAIDAGIELLIPGGERYNISNTMSDSVSSITAPLEAIWTGDTSAIDQLHNDHKAGKGTRLFEAVANAGEWFADEGGGARRAQVTGDFYGGADTASGRAAAFAASVPVLGHAGKFLGESAAKGVIAGKEAAAAVYERLTSDEYTLNPLESELWDDIF